MQELLKVVNRHKSWEPPPKKRKREQPSTSI
jgi:hypothetical protein